MPTYRAIVMQNDGRQARVLHDRTFTTHDSTTPYSVGDALIAPYEGGRSHVPGVTVALRGPDDAIGLEHPVVAYRHTDKGWQRLSSPKTDNAVGASLEVEDRMAISPSVKAKVSR